MLCTTCALALGVLLLAACVGGGGHYSCRRRGPRARAGVGVLEAGPRALLGPLPRHQHQHRQAENQFLSGLASDARRPCLSQGGLSRGDCGTPFRPTRLSSRTAEFWPRAGLGPFRPLPLSPPLPPLWAARVSPRAAGYGRPLRRADLAHSRVRTRRR